MKRQTLTIFLAFFTLSFSLFANAAVLIRSDLRLGMTSPEVKFLQQVLNTSLDTIVATNGAGSRGLETEYFGTKTLTALIKFQRKYYYQIGWQSPNQANGIVDLQTRTFINSLLTPVTSSASVQTPSESVPNLIALTNPYANTNFFSTSSLETLTPYLPSSFVPASLYSTSTSVRNGAFTTATNAIASLLKEKFNIVLPTTVATTTGIIQPKVGAIAPQISIAQRPASFSDVIIINGSGITKTNSVYTTLGHIDNVSAGTSTLSFRLQDLPGFSYYTDVSKEHLASTSVMIWINNENGISNVLGPYVVNF